MRRTMISRRARGLARILFATGLLTAPAACTAILGGFDFDGPPEGSGGSGGNGGSGGSSSSSSSTSSSGSTSSSSGSVAACDDGKRNGDESDVDCGGSCPKCGDDKGCTNGGDCVSKVCTGGTCVAATCTDTLENGAETDVDCGGPSCPKCAAEKGCGGDDDCVSGSCVGHVCASSCTDGVQDGDETDEDCGGASCPRCEVGGGCLVGPDCTSGLCESKVCESNYVWAKRFGDAAVQSPSGLAVDTAGSVIIAGTTQGTVDFEGGPLPIGGGKDLFLAKLDKDGAHKWSKVLGDTRDQSAFAVTTDASQNVLVAGTFQGTVNFGGGDLNSGYISYPVSAWVTSLFLAKLDTLGNHVWSTKHSGSTGSNVFKIGPQSLANDGEGAASSRTCLAGGYTSGVSFGSTTHTSTGYHDVFVASFDAAGTPQWSKSFGSAEGNEFATSVAFGYYSNSFIVVGGWHVGEGIDFGNGLLVPTALKGNAFIAKLSAYDGSSAWSKSFPTNDFYDVNAGTGVSVAVDSMGNIYAAGHQNTFAQTDFGGGPITGNFYLVKLDPDGNHLWSKGFTIAEITIAGTPVMISVDAADNVIISNKCGFPSDLGGGVLSQGGTYVAKYDPSGKHLWSRAYGDSAIPRGLGTQGANFAYLSGSFDGQLDFGGGPLTSLGSDIFLAKLLLP